MKKCEQLYTATSDTLAAIDLARYLDSLGIADRVTFGVTGDSTMNLIEKQSVVALGSPHTLHPFQDYLGSLNFSFTNNKGWGIENAHPAAGELKRYASSSQNNGRGIDAAIIALLPGHSPKTKLLIMESTCTAALVSLLTSQVENSLFERIYKEHGSPNYFEMPVEIEFDGDHIIRSWPVALHPYTKAAPTGASVTQ
jgi:hypothetical protein